MFHLENLWMLFGLFALAIPVLMHLLQRRHHETLDWGAMQFLPDSSATQRKRWLDEIALMLLRMAMIALLVLALATPTSTSAWLAPLGDRSTRDVVVVIDGSYSMDLRVPGQPTPWEDAVRWTHTYAGQTERGERTAIVVARQPPFLLQDGADTIAEIKARGNPDMPAALAEAWKHLQRSKAATKEIIVLTDGQRHGWADAETLAALESLGNQWHADARQAKTDGLAIPSLRVVKVGADLPKTLSNYALAPLSASHGVVKLGQEVTFQSALRLDGFAEYAPPRSVKAFVDGVEIKTLVLPGSADLKQGQIPLRFEHTFKKEGQHVVSLIVDADPVKDVLLADNEQHLVIDVVKELPILLIDGDKKLSAESSSFFLERALSKQAIPYSAFKPSALAGQAVMVLADVQRLDTAQLHAIDRFLAEGGGLLIVAGERVEKAFYNDQPWLPAKLGDIASSKDGVQPEPRSFQHPALELIRAAPDGGMSQARFATWWRVEPRDRAVPIGKLANGDPFLLEMPYKQGRVILCTVPLDRRWGSTLPSAVEFPILAHELAYYLAGSRSAASTLLDGAPIRLAHAPTGRLTLRTPEIDEKTVNVKSWPWVYDNTGAIGIYRVQSSSARDWSFVVPPDLGESDLTRCTEDDWRKVRDRLPIAWQADAVQDGPLAAPEARREELWWLFLLAVLGLLCMEVWMTRRLVLARGR
jgi:hypothetical protein